MSSTMGILKLTLQRCVLNALLLFALSTDLTSAQDDTLGLSDGLLTFNLSTLNVQVVKDSQTLYSLSPSGSSFNFVPSDVMANRSADGNYHLGDITFRARISGSTDWTSGDSSAARKNLTALPVSGSTLAAANLAPTLPSDSLLNITRRWVSENGQLQLLFDVTNSQNSSVEIGSLGAALEFNNIFTDRTSTETNEKCSLFDPYIGLDAGYVQVTPLLGTLPPLIVIPVGSSPLEGWRFLDEDEDTTLAYQSQTFEGLYSWEFHTLAYAENEWVNATPWNAPTSFTLEPNETRTYGLAFIVAPSIREIEDTLIAAGRPVAVGIPGFIIPSDVPAKLFLNSTSPISSLSVDPEGALSWSTNNESSWTGYTITGITWGRSRLSVTYEDNSTQTVHYYVTKPAVDAISDLGSFLTTEQWFDNSSDPFHRSPSVISYDRQVNAYVRDDVRAWIPGLSDEGGAGSWLAASMKQFVQPNADEVVKMETFINETLWGSVQNFDGSVKKSVYFYEPALVPNYTYPSDLDWGNWWSWTQAESYDTSRAYDYVHVTNAYWALYRVARNYPDLVSAHTWEWYLNQAVLTVETMTNGSIGYYTDGLMGETVFRLLLDDLQREGLTDNATLVQSRMQERETIWAGERYPFGSEMAWDSTGQEGVYTWARYFNDSTTAVNALNSILAYEPLIPHWGYNGNARRYWDNVYAGKLMRIERQIHHYGSGLNSLPLLSAFEASPNDTYLLRTGFGGISGPLSSIDEGGFAAASFHSFEDTLAWDGYSGDYGPNFVGLSMGTATFLVNLPTFGWQAFGGEVLSTSPTIRARVADPVRKRIFIAPLGQMLILDAGAFSEVEFDEGSQSVNVTILEKVEGVDGAAAAPNGRLLVSTSSELDGVGSLTPVGDFEVDAGAWTIPFTNGSATVTLTQT